ncbi:MAG: hypothetical protein JXA11_04470 [Phycisphaerae bacterium]|nr:hypothetical protein [Phycisphaerae bacterium]
MSKHAILFLTGVVVLSSCCLADTPTRVDPADLVYQGAFRLPDVGPEEYDWKWSGQALAYRPDGNPKAGKTDLPGSLIGSGHNWHQWVSEISIPTPVVSPRKNLTDLNTAATLQKFANITGTLYEGRYLEQARMGLAYLPSAGGAGVVYFCRAAHLDEGAKHPTLGVGGANFAESNPRGLWNVGGLANYVTDDYLLKIPDDWAAKHAPGKTLACGRFRDGGQASQGPTLFAFAPVDADHPPKPGAQLPAVALLKYPAITDADNRQTLKDYRHSDDWGGAAWLSRGGKSAVLFIGTKGVGKTWYGYANGLVWPEQPPYPDVPDYPNDQRGWWSERFEPRILFYDPEDLAKAAAGKIAAHEPQPYATMNLDKVLFLPAAKRPRQMRFLGASAHDSARGLLFVMEILVDDDRPVIHVWKCR